MKKLFEQIYESTMKTDRTNEPVTGILNCKVFVCSSCGTREHFTFPKREALTKAKEAGWTRPTSFAALCKKCSGPQPATVSGHIEKCITSKSGNVGCGATGDGCGDPRVWGSQFVKHHR